MAPLPTTLPDELHNCPNYHSLKSAYDRCLIAERLYESRAETDREANLGLVCVRIVGYLMHHAPTERALGTVVHEIVSCADDADLRDVGGNYLNAWTRAFKRAKGPTPAPSNHASRPSFDTLADMINDTLDTAPQSHSATKRSALIRDNFRCMVTRKYDRTSLNRILELAALDLEFEEKTGTECAHIFSESTNANIPPRSDKRAWAASMWAVMERFGYSTVPSDLNGAKIHRMENVMTLDVHVHAMFDSLDVWFIATDLDHWEDRKHIYKLEATTKNKDITKRYPKVIFSTDRTDLPLPSPDYLALHATCCKVAHLSGASEWFAKFEDDQDQHLDKTLANNGTSARLLQDILYKHILIGDTTRKESLDEW